MIEPDQLKEIFKQKEHMLRKDKDYHEELAFQIYGESEKRKVEVIQGFDDKNSKEIRTEYGVPVNWMWSWILTPINKIFSANGDSVSIKPDKKEFQEIVTDVIQLSTGELVRSWMQDNYFKPSIADPAGVVLMEWDEEKEWPVIYSVDKIKAYKKFGRHLEWIIFEPIKVKIDGKDVEAYRVIDGEHDMMFRRNGAEMELINSYVDKETGEEKEGIYDLPTEFRELGKGKWAPAILLGNRPDPKDKLQKISPIHDAIKLARQYYVMDSIKTFVAFRNGYGVWYWYTRQCKACGGKGKDDDGKNCGVCEGTGKIFPKRLNDVFTIDVGDEDSEKNIPEKPGGLIQGDVASWTEYRKELEEKSKQVELAVYSTHRTEMGDNNTATGTFVDSQTATEVFSRFSASAEFTESWICTYIAARKKRGVERVRIRYGRRLHIESPDTLFKRYKEAVEKGLSESVKTRMLREYYESEYKNDPSIRERMIKLMHVEPGVHMSIVEFIKLPVPKLIKEMKMYFSEWESQLSNEKISGTDRKKLVKELEEYVKQKSIDYGQTNSDQPPGGSEDPGSGIQQEQVPRGQNQFTGKAERTEQS